MTSSFERRDRVRAGLLTGDALAWLHAPWLEVCGRLLQFGASISAAACSRRLAGRSSARADALTMGWFNPDDLAGRSWSGRSPAGRPGTGRRTNPEADSAPGYSHRRPAYAAAAEELVQPPETPTVPYAELHCHSNFSFLDGVNDPEELIEEAVRLGLDALAITDHDGFYAASRFAEAAAAYPLRTIYGAELSLGLTEPQNGVADPEGQHLLVLARGVTGYHRLAAAITEAQLRGDEKGRPLYDLDELADAGRRSLADPDRLPQGCGPLGPRPPTGRPPRPRRWTG